MTTRQKIWTTLLISLVILVSLFFFLQKNNSEPVLQTRNTVNAIPKNLINEEYKVLNSNFFTDPKNTFHRAMYSLSSNKSVSDVYNHYENFLVEQGYQIKTNKLSETGGIFIATKEEISSMIMIDIKRETSQTSINIIMERHNVK